MVIAGFPREEIRHTWAVLDWLAGSRQEGRQDEAASVTLRHSTAAAAHSRTPPPPGSRPCPLEQLEALAAWLAANSPWRAMAPGPAWAARCHGLHGVIKRNPSGQDPQGVKEKKMVSK